MLSFEDIELYVYTSTMDQQYVQLRRHRTICLHLDYGSTTCSASKTSNYTSTPRLWINNMFSFEDIELYVYTSTMDQQHVQLRRPQTKRLHLDYGSTTCSDSKTSNYTSTPRLWINNMFGFEDLKLYVCTSTMDQQHVQIRRHRTIRLQLDYGSTTCSASKTSNYTSTPRLWINNMFSFEDIELYVYTSTMDQQHVQLRRPQIIRLQLDYGSTTCSASKTSDYTSTPRLWINNMFSFEDLKLYVCTSTMDQQHVQLRRPQTIRLHLDYGSTTCSASMTSNYTSTARLWINNMFSFDDIKLYVYSSTMDQQHVQLRRYRTIRLHLDYGSTTCSASKTSNYTSTPRLWINNMFSFEDLKLYVYSSTMDQQHVQLRRHRTIRLHLDYGSTTCSASKTSNYTSAPRL